MFEPVLTKYVGHPHGHTLDFYVEHGGYQALKTALGMTPDAIVDSVKKSGLRGRGGAGFPTGLKWSFVPKDNPKPKYLCINADESEPGTFKDHVLLERNMHLLYEGCVIACRAIGAKTCYIYIRGEFFHLQKQMEAELEKARQAGYVGRNILGSGQDCDIWIHRGAGAYEAGEETALIESLEGKRAQPRLKPPFPAVVGLYGCPTVVNNVETICNVPLIIDKGHEWFAGIGPEKNTGPKLFCVSGHVKKPGVYEAPMDTTLRQLIYDYAGGIRHDRQLKAVIPGGSSTPVLHARQARYPPQLRRHGRGRFDARVGRGDRHGRDHQHGLGGQEPDSLLQARVVRQVHALSRGRRLAVQDSRQDRAWRWRAARCRVAPERLRQHRRQDPVPVR